MYILILSMMREDKSEHSAQEVLRAETREELVAFVESQKVEPYVCTDMPSHYQNRWHKTYKKGGPLEWYNPPINEDFSPCPIGTGIFPSCTAMELVHYALQQHYANLYSIPLLKDGVVQPPKNVTQEDIQIELDKGVVVAINTGGNSDN